MHHLRVNLPKRAVEITVIADHRANIEPSAAPVEKREERPDPFDLVASIGFGLSQPFFAARGQKERLIAQ